MKGKKAKKLLKEAKKLIKRIKKQGKDGEMILAEVRKMLGAVKVGAKSKKAPKKKTVKGRSPKTTVAPKEDSPANPSSPPENMSQP